MPVDIQGSLLHAGVDISSGKIDLFQTTTNPFYINGKQSSQIEVVEISIAEAAMRASNTTPIELVAAPGALKAIKFHGAEWFLDYGSVVFAADANEDQVIAIDTGADVCSDIPLASFIVLSADTHYVTTPINHLLLANKALQVETKVGDITGGTGTVVQVRCYYEIVTLMT